MKTHRITRAATSVLPLILWLLLPQTAHCFYNPSTGRWLSRDPIQEEGGINLLAFCRNAPVDASDDLGADPDWPDAGDVATTYATGGVGLVAGVREVVSGYSDLNELASAIIENANPDQQIDMLIGLQQASGQQLSEGLRQAVKPMVTVLGRYKPDMGSILSDDKWFNEWKALGHNILNLPEDVYTRQKNIKWLSSAIRRGDEIYLASKPGIEMRENSAYWDELRYLEYAGYVRERDYMVKRKNW
jgi:uncharacterized protein RhaS with RHS repeats